MSRLAGLAACFLLFGPAWAQAPQNDSAGLGPEPFRVVSSPSRKLSISITQGLKPMRGVVLFPQPPETPAQHLVSVHLSVGGPKQELRGKRDGEWTFPFGKWTIQDRAGR